MPYCVKYKCKVLQYTTHTHASQSKNTAGCRSALEEPSTVDNSRTPDYNLAGLILMPGDLNEALQKPQRGYRCVQRASTGYLAGAFELLKTHHGSTT